MSHQTPLAQIEANGFNPSNPVSPMARWARKLEVLAEAAEECMALMDSVLEALQERGEANAELDVWWSAADRVLDLQHDAEEAREATQPLPKLWPLADVANRAMALDDRLHLWLEATSHLHALVLLWGLGMPLGDSSGKDADAVLNEVLRFKKPSEDMRWALWKILKDGQQKMDRLLGKPRRYIATAVFKEAKRRRRDVEMGDRPCERDIPAEHRERFTKAPQDHLELVGLGEPEETPEHLQIEAEVMAERDAEAEAVLAALGGNANEKQAALFAAILDGEDPWAVLDRLGLQPAVYNGLVRKGERRLAKLRSSRGRDSA